MKSQPVIIGVGRTSFGEHYDSSPENLVEAAGLQALDSASVERKDLDACYFSDYFLSITNKIGIEEGFLSELLELHVPMERMRSFSSALLNACHGVQSGKYNIVLVGGVEKMTDRWEKIRDDLMLLEDPWSYYAGCTPEANHELMLREYIKRFNISGDKLRKFNIALAQISVKNHHHAMENEYAQYHKEIGVNDVMNARSNACKPLGLYDFSPISDGASALILMSSETAKKYLKPQVRVLASSSATDYITFPSRESRTGFVASTLAMNCALRRANINIADIQVVELYDQSTLLEMISLEDLGFSEKGKSWLHIYDSCETYQGFYNVEGKQLYVNRNGGLKADGNPLGAAGGAQIFEVAKQLSDEAGKRQVHVGGEPPQFGCILELEGFGTKAYVHLLGRDHLE